MTDEMPIAEYYGCLGRVQIAEGVATLRFYPFVFEREEDRLDPVLEVVIEGADVTEAELQVFMSGDIEVSVFSRFVVIEEVCEGLLSRTISGTRLTAVHRAYDIQDYAERVKQLDARNAELRADLHLGSSIRNKLDGLVAELLRRAEIKAAASADHRLKQTEAIKVL